MNSTFPYGGPEGRRDIDRLLPLPTDLSGYGPPSAGEPAAEPNALMEVWSILLRRKWTVVLATLLGLAAGVFFTYIQTPMYRARASLEIQGVNSDFLNTRALSPTSDAGASVAVDIQTQQRILLSDELLTRVLAKLKASGKLKPLEDESSKQSFWDKTPITPKDLAIRIRGRAARSLMVRPAGQTKILEVLYNSRDPQLAADFVNTLVAEYIDSNIESRYKMSAQIGTYLARSLNETRTKLQDSEAALEAYANKAGLLFTTPLSGSADKTNVSEDKLRQLQEALSKAQSDLASAQSRYEIAKTAAPETLADVLNDQSLQELQAKLTDLTRQRAELSSIYTPRDEKVLRIDAQIGPVQAAFERKRDAILSSIHHDYETAERRANLLKSDFSGQAKVVTEEANKSIEYNILQREVDSNRQLYNSMLEEMKQATVISAIRASNVRVVDAATAPFFPSSPVLPLNAAAGLLLGMVGGVAYVCFRERTNSILKAPGETKLWTSLPELGFIPSASIEAAQRQGSKGLSSRTPRYIVASLTPSGRRKPSLEISEALKREPRQSPVGEAFRSVLTSLMLAGENGTRPRLLVLASGNMGEGKTTVVSNLGLAMAQVRQKVLIIDADMRSPRMHQLFELNNSLGLSTLLKDHLPDDETGQSIIQETSVPGLDVLTSGPASFDPAHLLYAPQLARLLSGLKSRYDVVLIDTPPSLHFADARIVARFCDAVIIVTRAGHTTKEETLALQQRFEQDRTRVLGSILNDWNPDKASSGAYRSYYYGGQRT